MTNIGDLIKSRRKDLNLSQRELAALIGCSDVFICYIERGRNLLPAQFAPILATALQVKESEVLNALRADMISAIDKKLA